jgi:16S rRNA (uracil1498-N3)-methyltransferase
MALPYFYEPSIQVSDRIFTLSEETSKHCIQVLRMREQESIKLTDGKGNSFTGVISKADKKHTSVTVQHSHIEPPPQKKLCIGISLLKNASRFEWFLEKATEIGASEIYPLLCNRTERQHFRHERLNGILIASMLQSQQVWLPIMHDPIKFTEALKQLNYSSSLIAHCEEGEKKPINSLVLTKDICMLIGPEGDFSTDEIELALQKNYTPVTLGNTRLRTETAAIVAVTLLINN